MFNAEERIIHLLEFLYGQEAGHRAWIRLQTQLDDFRHNTNGLDAQTSPSPDLLTEKDAILITYGDQIQQEGKSPLKTLVEFLETRVGNAISGTHILPFFPYSSDDGFSIIDYRQVNPELGNWEDLERLGQNYRLMVDGVINHISRQSNWFQSFLQDLPPYRDFFIAVNPTADLSEVVRPRALPLLTAVQTVKGTKWVWTTFSADQIDLNYSNPQLLLTIIDILLFYVSKGAEIIRLDAIAYLWKELGTPCIHLPKTHAVVKLFRAILDAVAPGVLLITETNVPHRENISYFGDILPSTNRTDEAQLVYQFSLAPLILHTFSTGNASVISAWSRKLETPSPTCTFFNFIASHDGIGVRPAEGILSPQEIEALVSQTLKHGGEVSYKTNTDGSKSAYELNITLYDMLNNPAQPDLETDVRRFLASQVIMLSLIGVPGIYFHSLIGAKNCKPCYRETGRARSINREKFTLEELLHQLNGNGTHSRLVFEGYLHLLNQRRNCDAFHPQVDQRILDLDDRIFVLIRASKNNGELILCLVNVSNESVDFNFHPEESNLPHCEKWRDLIGEQVYRLNKGKLSLKLEAYQSMWLQPQ
ncbi:MAG: sugar phosphorylase [Anaerolineales bacterium]